MEVRTGPCPLGKECETVKKENGKQVLIRCPWYVKVRGKDPQGEEIFDEYRCSWSWIPILLIEGSQRTREAGAAIESFRNEMVEQNRDLLRLSNGQGN